MCEGDQGSSRASLSLLECLCFHFLKFLEKKRQIKLCMYNNEAKTCSGKGRLARRDARVVLCLCYPAATESFMTISTLGNTNELAEHTH